MSTMAEPSKHRAIIGPDSTSRLCSKIGNNFAPVQQLDTGIVFFNFFSNFALLTFHYFVTIKERIYMQLIYLFNYYKWQSKIFLAIYDAKFM